MMPRNSYCRIEEQMPKNESLDDFAAAFVVGYNYGTSHRNSMMTYYHDDFDVEMMRALVAVVVPVVVAVDAW